MWPSDLKSPIFWHSHSWLKALIWLIFGEDNDEINVVNHVTLDCAKKWLDDFNAAKTQLVSFDRSNNNGSVDVKMVGSVFEEKFF